MALSRTAALALAALSATPALADVAFYTNRAEWLAAAHAVEDAVPHAFPGIRNYAFGPTNSSHGQLPTGDYYSHDLTRLGTHFPGETVGLYCDYQGAVPRDTTFSLNGTVAEMLIKRSATEEASARLGRILPLEGNAQTFAFGADLRDVGSGDSLTVTVVQKVYDPVQGHDVGGTYTYDLSGVNGFFGYVSSPQFVLFSTAPAFAVAGGSPTAVGEHRLYMREMTIGIVPEPTGVLALGLGGLTLLRRRKAPSQG